MGQAGERIADPPGVVFLAGFVRHRRRREQELREVWRLSARRAGQDRARAVVERGGHCRRGDGGGRSDPLPIDCEEKGCSESDPEIEKKMRRKPPRGTKPSGGFQFRRAIWICNWVITC